MKPPYTESEFQSIKVAVVYLDWQQLSSILGSVFHIAYFWVPFK